MSTVRLNLNFSKSVQQNVHVYLFIYLNSKHYVFLCLAMPAEDEGSHRVKRGDEDGKLFILHQPLSWNFAKYFNSHFCKHYVLTMQRLLTLQSVFQKLDHLTCDVILGKS